MDDTNTGSESTSPAESPSPSSEAPTTLLPSVEAPPSVEAVNASNAQNFEIPGNFQPASQQEAVVNQASAAEVPPPALVNPETSPVARSADANFAQAISDQFNKEREKG